MRRMLAGSLLGPPPRESMVPIGPFVLRSLINHSTVGRSGCLKIVCSLDVNYSDDMPIRADSVDPIMRHCSRLRFRKPRRRIILSMSGGLSGSRH